MNTHAHTLLWAGISIAGAGFMGFFFLALFWKPWHHRSSRLYWNAAIFTALFMIGALMTILALLSQTSLR
jgi:hypothetical protein